MYSIGTNNIICGYYCMLPHLYLASLSGQLFPAFQHARLKSSEWSGFGDDANDCKKKLMMNWTSCTHAVAQFQFSQQSYNVTEDEKFVPVCLDFVNYATERVTKNITFTLEYYNIGSGK